MLQEFCKTSKKLFYSIAVVQTIYNTTATIQEFILFYFSFIAVVRTL